MKNVPETIYLQVGDPSVNSEDEMQDFDFKEIEDVPDAVTWCRDRIFSTDIEFVRKDIADGNSLWHDYKKEPPTEELMAVVFYGLEFVVRLSFKVADGTYRFDHNKNGEEAIFWMQIPAIPKELVIPFLNHQTSKQ